MNDTLRACLDDLAARIDPAQERANRNAWVDFLENRCPTEIFIAPPRVPAPAKINWPDIGINEACDDYDAMLLQQFKVVSDVLAGGGGSVLNIRCNYGTGILPTLFGCDLYMMDVSTNTLPTALPMGEDKIKSLLDAGLPDTHRNLGGKVFEAAGRFLQALDAYPILKEHIRLFHPDAQGPIDVAELVWGSEIFLAFYDNTDLLKDFLRLTTETYQAFLREWFALVGREGEYSAHWGALMKGHLMIRNDSLMNLSPQIYTEYVRPLDQQLFDEFGGGAIHFCGRGDHFIKAMCEMAGLTGIQLSQPEYNDMEVVYQNTVDQSIKLINLDRPTAEAAARPLRGQAHCF